MYTIHNGKLYRVNGDRLVGVDITPTNITLIEGSEIKTPQIDNLLTLKEVKFKFGVSIGESYMFPREVVEKDIEDVEVEKEQYPHIDDITKKDIVTILKTKGINFKPYDSKAVLYGIMIEG